MSWDLILALIGFAAGAGTSAIIVAAILLTWSRRRPVELPRVSAPAVPGFGPVGDPIIYHVVNYDVPQLCVGDICHHAPFIEGQACYAIPVAVGQRTETTYLVCLDCVQAQITPMIR